MVGSNMVDKPGLESRLSSLDRLAGFFTLLVVIGVGGEYVVHILSSRASTRLIALQSAEEQKLQAEVVRLGSATAEANEKTAQLEKENLEIKRRMADRFLTDREQETLVSALSPYSGHHITVAWIDAREVKDYATAIITVLEKAGWMVQSNRIWTYAPAKTPRGLVCKVARQPDGAIETLKTAFRDLGITLKTEVADAQQESFIHRTYNRGEKPRLISSSGIWLL